MSVTRRDVVASHALSDAFTTRVQKYRSLFAAVWRRRCQAASLGCKTPFLHVGFNKDETHLSKVHVHLTRPLGAHGGKEVLCLETVRHIIELFAIASEEDCSSARPVANADDVSLDVCGTVCGRGEGLVVATITVRAVCDRRLVIACMTVNI